MPSQLLLLLALLGAPSTASTPAPPLLEELSSGQILLWESYPYRTVQDPEATLAAYRMARLGHTGVREFQRASHLKGDGVIGLGTCRAASAAYPPLPAAAPISPSQLTLSVRRATNGFDYEVALANSAPDPVTLIGLLRFRDSGTFTLSAPAVFVGGGCDITDPTGIACTVWSRTLSFGDRSVTVPARGSITRRLSVSALARCTGGFSIAASIGVLGSDLRPVVLQSR